MEKKYPIEFISNDDAIIVPILVDNLKKAKAFYGNIFGFHPAFEGAEELGWSELFLPVKGVKLGLDVVEKLPQKSEIRNAAISFSVKSLETTKKYLETKNIKTSKIRDIPNMVSLLDCWDPFGNLILLMSEPRVKEQK
jgi:predicted enzyme related to lactoylglutathione lyase